MTKKEFTAAVVEKSGVALKKDDAQKMVDAVIDVIVDEMKAGNKVSLAGLGIFSVVDKKERMARNPKTKETTMVPACKAAKFKAAKALKEELNA